MGHLAFRYADPLELFLRFRSLAEYTLDDYEVGVSSLWSNTVMFLRSSALPAFACLCLAAIPLGCGSSSGNGSGGPGPAPVLTSLSPSSAVSGSSEATVTAKGANFTPASSVEWNGAPLATTYMSSTTLVTQIPAVDLSSVGNDTITVTDESGTSGGLQFAVISNLVPGETMLNVFANDIVWDPVHQVIYLSLFNFDGNTSTVQALDPTTGILGAAATVGSGANLLSVSKNGKYLYVGLDGTSSVQRMTLPDLGTDITIPLGSDAMYGRPYVAMDLQAGPTSDGTVAIVRGTTTDQEGGGVAIYDDSTERPDYLCGWSQNACADFTHGGDDIFDSIQWNADGSEMYAVNYQNTGGDFYAIPVTSAGFGSVSDYPGLAPTSGDVRNAFEIHFDPTTNYVYYDNGEVIDPGSGTLVGTFSAGGVMVPDGSLGKAFFVGKLKADAGTTTYTLESFDIHSFTPIATLTIQNVVGVPRHLIRWGSDGLAFTTCSYGYVSFSCPINSDVQGTGDEMGTPGGIYIIQGSFVNGSASRTAPAPTENVQRTWRLPPVTNPTPSEDRLTHSFMQ